MIFNKIEILLWIKISILLKKYSQTIRVLPLFLALHSTLNVLDETNAWKKNSTVHSTEPHPLSRNALVAGASYPTRERGAMIGSHFFLFI